MSDNPDIPEIPAHIAARKAMALTPQTAELVGQKEYMDDSGTVRGGNFASQKRANAASQKAARDAEAYAGPYPLSGLTPLEIQAIRGKVYPDTDQPKMTPQMGDRTPAWVNWLWAKYPWDAAKRFGGTRLVWPTALPANWPPKAPLLEASKEQLVARALATPDGVLAEFNQGMKGQFTLEQMKAAAALLNANELPKATRYYSQAEVDAMMASVKKATPEIEAIRRDLEDEPPAKPAPKKRIRNRSKKPAPQPATV